MNLFDFYLILLLAKADERLALENKLFFPAQLAKINLNPRQQSYPATARFWGVVATGVNQVSTVTINLDSPHRLSVAIILPQKCSRIFAITGTKITQVTHACPNLETDESSQYTNWIVSHNAIDREIKMIAPPVPSDNPLYIRNQAFWTVRY